MTDPCSLIRVLVADDHPVVRAGIRAMLGGEPDIEVVGEAGSAQETIDAVEALRPAVVLMDLRMPGGGVEATAALAARSASPQVVVLTTYGTDAEILRAVEAGATGYLLKGVSRTDMVEAVRAAHRGEAVLGPDAMAALARHLRRPRARAVSEREREVLALVAQGASNAQVARRLHIEEATVKTYLLRIFDKLDVRDRTAAVTAALAQGLIELPGDGDLPPA